MIEESEHEFYETAIWSLNKTASSGALSQQIKRKETAEILKKRFKVNTPSEPPTRIQVEMAQKTAFNKLCRLSDFDGCDIAVLKALADFDVWHDYKEKQLPSEFRVPIELNKHPRELRVHLEAKELGIVMDALQVAATEFDYE